MRVRERAQKTEFGNPILVIHDYKAINPDRSGGDDVEISTGSA